MARWVKDQHCLCQDTGSVPGPAQWVKDPVLLQLQLLLRFYLWPRNFHMPQVWPKLKKKKRILYCLQGILMLEYYVVLNLPILRVKLPS